MANLQRKSTTVGPRISSYAIIFYMSSEKPNSPIISSPQVKLFNGNGEPTPESLKTGDEKTVAEKFKALTGVPLSSYYMLTSTIEGEAELRKILEMSPEEARACLAMIEMDEDKSLPRYWLK